MISRPGNISIIIIQAWAGMKDKKATPYGNPPEGLFKYIPFAAKVDIARLMIQYYTDLIARPSAWNVLQHIGLHKEDGVPSFEGIRWIGGNCRGTELVHAECHPKIRRTLGGKAGDYDCFERRSNGRSHSGHVCRNLAHPLQLGEADRKFPWAR